MFVSNLSKAPLGIDGLIILKPKEEKRFVEDTEELVTRVKRLLNAGLVEVDFAEGLTKAEVVAPEAPPEVIPEPKVAPEPQFTSKKNKIIEPEPEAPKPEVAPSADEPNTATDAPDESTEK